VVNFLNAIEQGAPWPDAMRQTRAVFFSKDPNAKEPQMLGTKLHLKLSSKESQAKMSQVAP